MIKVTYGTIFSDYSRPMQMDCGHPSHLLRVTTDNREIYYNKLKKNSELSVNKFPSIISFRCTVCKYHWLQIFEKMEDA